MLFVSVCCEMLNVARQFSPESNWYSSLNIILENNEKQFPDANLLSNKAISHVIRKLENEYSIDDLLHSGPADCLKCRKKKK